MAMPIMVEGHYWGVTVAATLREDFTAGTESRMADFMELAALAIANARAERDRGALEASRDELARLLAEQAALRRVATLVARGIDPVEIFSAVAGEFGRLLDADNAGISRFDPDGPSVVIVGSVGEDAATVPIGTQVEIPDYFAVAVVWRTGRSAQVDEDMWDGLPGPAADRLRKLGIRSMVASPIIVESRLWGVVNVSSRQGPFPADAADRLADFTELLATAVGNAESQGELAASRARVVTAADQARRRIERDLHDGTQQRLVSLGLELRLTQSMVPAGLPELKTEIGRVADELTGVVEDLREIARGIHPAILSEGGLGGPADAGPPGRGRGRARGGGEYPAAGAGRGSRVLRRLRGAHQRDQARARHSRARRGRGTGRRPAPVGSRRRRGRRRSRPRFGPDRPPRPGRSAGGSLEISSPPGEGTLMSVQLPLQLH